jgi:hypothetical protein
MAFQQRQHPLRVRLRGAVGEGRDGNLDAIHARVDGGQVAGRAQAGGVVGVQGDGDADLALEFLDQIEGDARLDDARHVLDAQGIAAHLFQLDPHLDKVLHRMNGADGVAKFAAGVFLAFLDGLMAVSRLRRSLRASKMRMMSMPKSHMQRTKASTTSSGKLAYWTMFWPRRSMICGVWGAAFLRVRRRSKGFSLRKRRQESMVAPPQVSRPWKPMPSRMGAAGSIWGVVMRVAAMD